MYRGIRNAYYTGCFAQVEKPTEFYDKIVNNLSAEPQTAEDMFSVLKNVTKGTQDGALDSRFHIPLKLMPDFDVGVFSYIYWMEAETFKLYLPDVALSLDGEVLKPNNCMYFIKAGLVNIKYNGQVYTIVMIRAGS
ncbi:hypothetical protein SBF1_5200003 [Candidatus Desulfosporosinus infrequens]|uniref:Uncharacterized protein n=1 Tax=Candidatus Desulfosporosinus infrequens TaxID=2043169 RepID=A0A2U3LI30_9FIRM|nr:hypothetical protein SBF1_5200003 [Candidatus Desulfosporosinus infrequens]